MLDARTEARRLWSSRHGVLGAVAHPDDAEIFFGGALLKNIRQGKRVGVVVATSGDKCCAGSPSSSARVAKIRESEQRAAARCAGFSEVAFLRLPDGGLQEFKAALKERLCYYIRLWRPASVYTFDPGVFYFSDGRIQHPDHRAVGEAALAAVHCGSSLPLFYPDHRRKGLSAWQVREVLLAGSLRPNLRVDIRGELARKRRLGGFFKSQTADRPSPNPLKSCESFRRLEIETRLR